MDVALLSISPASHGQLVKMLITLELHGIFGSNCICVYSKHCPAFGMLNFDEAAGKNLKRRNMLKITTFILNY